MVWYSHLLKNFPHFVVIHTVTGFGIVNKAEVDVFLELSCYFDDPTDVDNLISGSSAFSKTSLNIWKFTAHILLKPGLENFEHYFTSMWYECNCAVVWAFFGICVYTYVYLHTYIYVCIYTLFLLIYSTEKLTQNLAHVRYMCPNRLLPLWGQGPLLTSFCIPRGLGI